MGTVREDLMCKARVVEILIITPPGGLRNPLLLEQLQTLSAHRVVQIDAVMIDHYPLEFDRARADVLQNRPHMPRELGCATSHMRAYQHITGGLSPWAVVLEDDAVILDLVRFSALLDRIESMSPAASGTLITLCSPGAVVRRSDHSEFPECIFEPAIAVAYVISKDAARALIKANHHLGFIADWPRGTSVEFRTADVGIIDHGGQANESLIGDQRRATRVAREFRITRPSISVLINRLQLYGFVTYLRNRRVFDSPKQYYRFMLRHRIIILLARSFGRQHPRLRRGVLTLPWPRSRSSKRSDAAVGCQSTVVTPEVRLPSQP
jgi:hypothetical protein